MKEKTINIFWFRRDLRIADNHGFYAALTAGKPVLPVFIFDTVILLDLEKDDSRVTFLLREVQKLHHLFKQRGSSFRIFHDKPLEAFRLLLAEYHIDTVFFNQDDGPYAVSRDREVTDFLASAGVKCLSFKDHVIFHRNDILNEAGKPYSVFTPYSKKWKMRLSGGHLQAYPSEKNLDRLLRTGSRREDDHVEIGFRPGNFPIPPLEIDTEILRNYHQKRDFPAEEGTTRLGIHLRFGTVSIRKVTAAALAHSDTFLNELIWRNFYIDILWHFPHVWKRSFHPAYDHVPWISPGEGFVRWCEGTTGYPMVDAGMRQLNETGYMHNRVRMVVASFLSKHLLTDWRLGEAYFAGKLLDYELASNNGGWQWAAGSGCDAAPYFRVFNPLLQQKKFDPDEIYVRRWIPEYGTARYPKPVVDHRMARERAVRVYRQALRKE